MIHNNLYKLILNSVIIAVVQTIIILFSSCKKIEREIDVKTDTVSEVTTTTAKALGDIIDLGNGVTDHGHCWQLFVNPTIADSKTSLGLVTKTGRFTSDLQNLEPGKTYHVRAYVKSGNNRIYGADVSFTTTQMLVPTLTTSAVTSITLTTAVSGGNITSDGGGSIASRGICWATTANPTISHSKTKDGIGTGIFTSNLSGLLPDTTYHIRAYATNNAGTAYGNDVSFTISPIVVPSLTTSTATLITLTTAVSGGNITSDGGRSVTARGICWATTANPTITSSKTIDGTGTGIFTSNLSGLLPGTTYYVRAYATNSTGAAYGNEIIFTTNPVVVPTLTTTSVTSITLTTAVSGGIITSDGGGIITVRGVCWSTTTNPTISNSKTMDGTGTGSFTSYLAGLTPGLTYYVRAYATNSAGIGYGNEVSFTLSPILVPTLTTTAITSVTLTTSISGGNVTADGGGSITARGICWATSASPTLSNFSSSSGTGIGSFIGNLTGLVPGTTYYVRAFAINSAGTSYGNEIRFNTKIGDADGNTYNVVSIGTQIWMAENLKTTQYNDGTTIPLVTDGTAWWALSTPGYCFYNNDATTYKDAYGVLYNWYAVDAASNGGKNICPAGWHVPADDEWKTLEMYLGMSQIDADSYGSRGASLGVGGMLKESGLSHWSSPNYATNSTGFTAMPGGDRLSVFTNINVVASYWSTTLSGDYPWRRLLICLDTYIFRGTDLQKSSGSSVRCLKD